MIVRTVLFAWRQRGVVTGGARRSMPSAVAAHLAAAVRCQTVPQDDRARPTLKPSGSCTSCWPIRIRWCTDARRREVISGYSLLYTWQGSHADLEPVMLMAHQDVVSADPAGWTHPPFEGVIADGFVWGRGTLDIKNQLIGIMEAAETLLHQGYRPERTILFGLGHDEETGGVNGCKVMGQLLKERGVRLAGIVDEGGGISAGLAPGVRGPVALVAVSEKGYLTVEFTVQGQPGHSSTPPPQTAIGILARALARLEAKPMPTHLRRLRPLYHGIGIAAPIYLQVAFANIWLFGALLRRWLERNPEMNASMRTTTALTIVRGGVEDNTVPAEARAIVNFRLARRHDCRRAGARQEGDRGRPRALCTGRGQVQRGAAHLAQQGPAYDSLSTVIRQVFDNPPVAPFVMLGGTDCQHFVPVCDNIYRFTSLVMDESFRGLEHGIDERIPIDGMAKMVTFYAQLMQVWGRNEATPLASPSACPC